MGDREVAGCLWGLLGGLVSSHGSELDPVLVQGCPRPQGTCACGVRGQHVCVHVTPCYPQGVYVCFQVHMEMVACWEGVRPPACAKAVSWEMRAGASRQVGGSVQPLGARELDTTGRLSTQHRGHPHSLARETLLQFSQKPHLGPAARQSTVVTQHALVK